MAALSPVRLFSIAVLVGWCTLAWHANLRWSGGAKHTSYPLYASCMVAGSAALATRAQHTMVPVQAVGAIKSFSLRCSLWASWASSRRLISWQSCGTSSRASPINSRRCLRQTTLWPCECCFHFILDANVSDCQIHRVYAWQSPRTDGGPDTCSAFWVLFYVMEAGAIMTILTQHGGDKKAAVRATHFTFLAAIMCSQPHAQVDICGRPAVSSTY
jgi:hypothetical protein